MREYILPVILLSVIGGAFFQCFYHPKDDQTRLEAYCQREHNKVISIDIEKCVNDLEYLEDFGLRFCNTARSYHSTLEDKVAESGSYPNCQAGNGIFDLTGNLREWTGEVDSFGDWRAGISLSSVTSDEPSSRANCSSVERFEFTPLQGAQFDFSDSASIRQFQSELSADEQQQLDQSLAGFRCCR